MAPGNPWGHGFSVPGKTAFGASFVDESLRRESELRVAQKLDLSLEMRLNHPKVVTLMRDQAGAFCSPIPGKAN